MTRMKEGFFGLNILAACNALSLPPDNTDLLVEDMGEFSIIINSVSTSCFTYNSLDISFSFKLPCLFLSLLDGYSISVAVTSNTRTWNFEFPLYLKTKKYP